MLSIFRKIFGCFGNLEQQLQNRKTHIFNRFSRKPYAIYYDVKTGKKRKITDINMSGFILNGCTQSVQSIIDLYPDDWLLCIGYEYNGLYDCQIGLTGSIKTDELDRPILAVIRECKEETGIQINIENLTNIHSCIDYCRINSYTCRLDGIIPNTNIVYKTDSADSSDSKNKIQLMIHGTLKELEKKVKNGLKNLKIYNPDGIDHIVLMPIDIATIIATDITLQKGISNFNGYKFGITFRKLYNMAKTRIA